MPLLPSDLMDNRPQPSQSLAVGHADSRTVHENLSPVSKPQTDRPCSCSTRICVAAALLDAIYGGEEDPLALSPEAATILAVMTPYQVSTPQIHPTCKSI